MDLNEFFKNEKYKEAFQEIKNQNESKQSEYDIVSGAEAIDSYIQYYNNNHPILDTSVKPDKIFTDKDGKTRKVKLNRLPVQFPKKIVNTATNFLFGKPLNYYLSDENKNETLETAFENIKNVWNNNKLDYFNWWLSQTLMIETKVAELWYITKERELRVKMLCRKNGDIIYPYFDENDKLSAFAREYTIKTQRAKNEKHVDIYTDESIYEMVYADGNYQVTMNDNILGKKPIVYYEQEAPEWDGVKELIERYEKLLSGIADANDYYGDPILKIFGKIKDAPDQETAGKVLQFIQERDASGKNMHGDANYLERANNAESQKLELDKLKDLIYSLTSTPDLSFNNVKDVGALSGVAIKMMFFDTIIKSQEKQAIVGEGMTRRFNLLKAFHSKLLDVNGQYSDMNIDFEFDYGLPENVTELINNISKARSGEPFMSNSDAVQKNPLVVNEEQTIDELEQEKEQSKINIGNMAGSFE